MCKKIIINYQSIVNNDIGKIQFVNGRNDGGRCNI